MITPDSVLTRASSVSRWGCGRAQIRWTSWAASFRTAAFSAARCCTGVVQAARAAAARVAQITAEAFSLMAIEPVLWGKRHALAMHPTPSLHCQPRPCSDSFLTQPRAMGGSYLSFRVAAHGADLRTTPTSGPANRGAASPPRRPTASPARATTGSPPSWRAARPAPWDRPGSTSSGS
jgi:hypothetical protein